MNARYRDDYDHPESEDYHGPYRRRGEPDHKSGEVPGEVHINGPSWLGGLSLTGGVVVPALALLIIAATSGVGTWLNYETNKAQTAAMIQGMQIQAAALEKIRLSAERDHAAIARSVEQQNELDSQTLCMATIATEAKKERALLSGDVCGYIGLRRGRPNLFDSDEGVRGRTR